MNQTVNTKLPDAPWMQIVHQQVKSLRFGDRLNRRLNRNVKLSLNYEHATLDEAEGAKLPFTTESVIFTRVQFAF